MGTDPGVLSDHHLGPDHGTGTNHHPRGQLGSSGPPQLWNESAVTPFAATSRSIHQGEHQFTGAGQIAVHRGLRLDLAEALALEAEQFTADHQPISRNHRAPEAYPVNAGETNNPLGRSGIWVTIKPPPGPWPPRSEPPASAGAREMPLELGLIHGHVLDRRGRHPGLMGDHPVHQSKGQRWGSKPAICRW